LFFFEVGIWGLGFNKGSHVWPKIADAVNVLIMSTNWYSKVLDILHTHITLAGAFTGIQEQPRLHGEDFHSVNHGTIPAGTRE